MIPIQVDYLPKYVVMVCLSAQRAGLPAYPAFTCLHEV